LPDQPFTSERFGGLNLIVDPQEVGAEAAVDLLNVDLDRPGRARTRDGLAQYDTSGSLTDDYYRLIPDYTSTSNQLLAVRSTVLAGDTELYVDRLSGTGTTLANVGQWDTNSGTNGPVLTAVAAVGTPLVSRLFFASHNGATALRKLQSGSISSTTGSPAYIAASPWQDGRLVQGWFLAAADSPTGANGSPSTVFFSNAGGPETYDANDYVHLSPGDGEEITGMATFGDLLIVSKVTQLFVFYGSSVGAAGTPIFHSRRVSIPTRLANVGGHGNPEWNALVTGDDGVYFVTSRGLYRTTGGPPVLVSGPMTPVFDGTAGSLAWDPSFGTMKLALSRERIFLSYTAVGGAKRTLVYDRLRDFWTVWAFPGEPLSITGYAGTDGGREAVFLTQTGVAGVYGHVYKLTEDQTSDHGTAIESYWESGLYELGAGTAFTRWTRVWGTGTPTVNVLTDHATSDTRAGSVALGSSITEGIHQQAYTGRLFAHKLSATSGAWLAARLQHDVAAVKP
jgi:hypothetical protein